MDFMTRRPIDDIWWVLSHPVFIGWISPLVGTLIAFQLAYWLAKRQFQQQADLAKEQQQHEELIQKRDHERDDRLRDEENQRRLKLRREELSQREARAAHDRASAAMSEAYGLALDFEVIANQSIALEGKKQELLARLGLPPGTRAPFDLTDQWNGVHDAYNAARVKGQIIEIKYHDTAAAPYPQQLDDITHPIYLETQRDDTNTALVATSAEALSRKLQEIADNVQAMRAPASDQDTSPDDPPEDG